MGEEIAVIEVKQLTRSYGETVALQPLSRKFPNGQIYGILGADGAGKSTLLELLAGVLAPTEGSVKINGFDMRTQPLKARRCIGYVPADAPLYEDLTPIEALCYLAEVHGVSYERGLRRMQESLARTLPKETHDRPIRHLTSFQRCLFGIAQALMGEGDILLLDQPTHALGQEAEDAVFDLLSDLREKHTVFITDDRPDTLLSLCDQILVLSGGELIFDLSAQELQTGDTLAQLRKRLEEDGATGKESPLLTRKKKNESSAPSMDGEYEVIDGEEGEDA